MRADEIRETFLSFFEERDHRRMPSASLVPSTYDPSVLLTTAGMQPFKPYFRGEERPPDVRLTSCQKCFRTTDIENVGTTKRHLTFFEMLGNFSFGDYFKQGAVEFAFELSTKGFGFDPERIWITVFGGDGELGLGPDDEAIECWRSVGVSDERIVHLGREDNFWQAGPTGPCGPCSELYLDRGPEFGPDTDRPGDDTERVLEFWNLVFMQYELHEDGTLEPLPAKNIDTGLGLDRLAAILALFGEKYGDIVRMVEIEGVSRELCGGTHVATTAEIGPFHVSAGTSSAANVRRVEALTGPAGIGELRARTEALREIAAMLRVPEPEVVSAVQKLTERVKELQKRPREADRGAAERLLAAATELSGVRVVAEVVEAPDAKALLELSDQVRQKLGDAAVVLGCAVDGKVHLVANVAPSVVERGVKAGDVVRQAAQVAGGGGGGRDTMAQAGGRDPDKLPEAIATARLAIESALR